MPEWFRRFADIPGVGYAGDPRIWRSRLPGHDAVPRHHRDAVGGSRSGVLTWSTKEGYTSASPASLDANASSSPQADEFPQAQLQRLYEALELPGTASDYHFAIQHCIGVLWNRRRQEPGLLGELERLCLLNIRLIEARPATITDERDGKVSFYRVLAFDHLLKLYEQEGFLAEAHELAKLATRFGQAPAVEQLRERLASVEAEG